ncbi:MAG: serine hydrolase [bacterium]|nr:serine hydrolase [bacterium]
MKMKVSMIFILFLFMVTVPGVPGYAGDSGEAATLDLDNVRAKLDKMLPLYKKNFEVPGMVVGILKDGKVVYSNALGVRRLGSDRKMTTRSLFHMASVSKPFVATAIMQLVEKGKIKLDGKLVEYLPYFKLADQRYKDITIRQMLSHSSGIPDVDDYEWDKPQYDDGAAERYIRSLVDEKMLFKPGEGVRYSNMAFDILADVIARASGMTFEQYVKKNIFDPLGMTDSTFLKKEVSEELENNAHVVGNVLTSEVKVSKVYPYNRAHAPSSTLHSNVNDMMRWGMANLNKGTLDGKRILKAESYNLLWAPVVRASANTNVGLSWFLGSYKGEKTVNHGGADVGFRSYFVMLPAKGIAVVTMGNCDTMDTRATKNLVLDLLLGHEPTAVKKMAAIPVARMLGKKGVKEAIRLYHRLKTEQPDRYSFSEGLLNLLGYGLMQKRMFDEAIGIFALNVSEYPGSWNTYDSLAEAYKLKGDKKNALINYKKAYEKNPGKSASEKRAAENQARVIKELGEDTK